MVESLPSILKVVGSIPGICLACVITNTTKNKVIKVKYIKKRKEKNASSRESNGVADNEDHPTHPMVQT